MTYPCLLPVVQVEHLRHDLAGGRQDVLELPRLVLLLLLAGLFLLLLFLLLDHQRLQDVPGPVKGADTAAEEDLRPEFFLKKYTIIRNNMCGKSSLYVFLMPEVVSHPVEVVLVEHDLADGAVEGGLVQPAQDVGAEGLEQISNIKVIV